RGGDLAAALRGGARAGGRERRAHLRHRRRPRGRRVLGDPGAGRRGAATHPPRVPLGGRVRAGRRGPAGADRHPPGPAARRRDGGGDAGSGRRRAHRHRVAGLRPRRWRRGRGRRRGGARAARDRGRGAARRGGRRDRRDRRRRCLRARGRRSGRAAVGGQRVPRAVPRPELARAEPRDPVDHRRLRVDLGGVRDGRDRGGARRHPPRRPRGGPGRRRDRVAGLPPGDGAAARAGAPRRRGHADDQRAEGVRPRARDPAGVDPVRRERARARDVAGLVRRGPRPGTWQRPRRDPVPARHPGDGVQHPSIQEREPVSTPARSEPVASGEGRAAPRPAPAEGTRRGGVLASIGDRVSRGLVGAVLTVVGLLWLVPALGLAVSSLREPSDINTTGWWTVLTEPTQLTIDNYRELLQNDRIVQSFWNTVLITVPSTVLVVLIAAFAAYAFAWVDFPGRDAAFLVVVALLVVPI